MRWYYDLTSKQQRILQGLALAVVIVFGSLVWTVWFFLQGGQAAPLDSPLASPVAVTATEELAVELSPSSPTVTPTPAFDMALAGAVSNAVTEARNVLPRWGTPLMLVDDYDLALSLYRYYAVYPPFVQEIRPTLEALNLWLWDEVSVDPREQAKRAAALYVPEEEQLYLRRDWAGSPKTLEVQLAYGYARAIPDQYGDLLRQREHVTSLDRRLALRGLADGDAMISLWRYAHVAPTSSRAEALREEVAIATVPRWSVDDPLLRDISRLSLEIGTHFAAGLYAEGGTAALDDAIRRPPRSTEQLLHPQRYLESDEPRLLTPLLPELGEGWELWHVETVGEAMMGLALLEWSNGEVQPDAVEGWGGDLLQVWRGPKGERMVVWEIAWDSGGEAAGFYGTLASFLPRPLVRGLVRDTTPSVTLPRGRWWAGRQGALFLYRRSDTIWLIWGDDPAAVEVAGAALKVP